jgi:hypothetical protein
MLVLKAVSAMRLTREDKLPNCTLVRLNAIAPETQEQEEVKDYDTIGLAPYDTDKVENGFLY